MLRMRKNTQCAVEVLSLVRVEYAMKHDLEDIIDIVRLLEQRIIKLERMIDSMSSPRNQDDQWYWLHG